jgi:hypothetical protein
MKNKQVEFEGEIVLDDWRVVATYEHPDVFKVNIFQEEGQRERIGVGIQLTKDQLKFK